MISYLVENFTSYAHSYLQVLIWLYILGSAVLYAYWLNPFAKRSVAAYAVAALFLAAQILLAFANTSKETDRLVTVGVIIISVFIFWYLDEKRNLVQKIFLCVVFRLIAWSTMEIFIEIGWYEGEFIERFDWYVKSLEAMVIEYLIWNPIQYLMALVLLYLMVRILHKTYSHKSDDLTWQELVMLITPAWALLLVKPIMSSYMQLWMDGIQNGSIKENLRANPYRLLFSIFSLLSVLIIIMFYQKIKDMKEEEYALKSLDKQINDTHRHVEHIEDIYEKMRSMRHDFGNHLTVIERLASNGNTKELAEYISELQNRVDNLQPTVKTGNAVADVVLSETSDRCAKEGIIFESDFTYPEKLSINPFDLSVVLTNALQNAIEAADCVSDPVIRIKSVIRDRIFIINVRNKTSHKSELNCEGLPETTKNDSGHGLGLKNIRSIARKYNGDIEIRQEECERELWFILNIMLMG